jgi:DNA primase
VSSELVNLIRADVELRRIGAKRWAGFCPFHNEKTPSFHVWDTGQKWRWHCHGCKETGDILDWYMKFKGYTWQEARGAVQAPIDTPTYAERRRINAERRRRQLVLVAYRDRNPDCVVPDWAIQT